MLSRHLTLACIAIVSTYVAAATTERSLDHRFISEEDALTEKWGKWKFYDGSEEVRPAGDYCASYPNRDIPGDDFPAEAWQQDAVYVNHFLNEALQLVGRAKEAIYTEYGVGKEGSIIEDEAERKKIRREMFHVEIIDCDNETNEETFLDKMVGMGGWICKNSFHGLVKRLTHAIMTNDSFNVAMGGHSAAAGHGNHLVQSYTIQIGVVLAPLFEKLGVKFTARNVGYGGLGTGQTALGARDILGPETDFLIWDSAMTETDKFSLDLFVRHGLLMDRAPVIISDHHHKGSYHLHAHKHYHADIGRRGKFNLFPETTSDEQAESLPWALQYLQCSPDFITACRNNDNKYRTQCWVERDDFTPVTRQRIVVGGGASWHPGFRSHQADARAYTMIILSALDIALSEWSDVTITEGHPLRDEYWHVTDHYKRIHDAVKDAPGPCLNEDRLPKRACTVALNARTEFTPRANPDQTSIRSIARPDPDGKKMELQELAYEGKNLPNPMLQLPDGKIDVKSIVSNRKLSEFQYSEQDLNRKSVSSDIVPGSYWYANGWNGFCDGTIDSSDTCHRENSNNCLLSGHNDFRSGVMGDEYSGWLVLDLKDVKEGIIMLKIHTWKNAKIVGGQAYNPLTEGMDVDGNRNLRGNIGGENSSYHRELHEKLVDTSYSYIDKDTEDADIRELKKKIEEVMPESFEFDFAINGKVTTWDKEKFLSENMHFQRVVEIFTLLDDENWDSSDLKNGNDVELALRVRGTGRIQTLDLTHVYWA